jgi:hypothetical protein
MGPVKFLLLFRGRFQQRLDIIEMPAKIVQIVVRGDWLFVLPNRKIDLGLPAFRT